MDWRHPNVGCLFHREATQAQPPRDMSRYVRSVKNPTNYNLVQRDYDRDHRPRDWPSGTEYQYAYCSNYRAGVPPRCAPQLGQGVGQAQPRTEVWSRNQDPCTTPRQQSFHELYKVTPLPILDKHYRGARYKVDDPIGVPVPEELSRQRDSLLGSARLSCQEDLANIYVPSYRYKDWIDRPMIEIYKELDAPNFFCPLPEIPTHHYDFYNIVRMRRPARKLRSVQNSVPCSILPLPAAKDLPDISTRGNSKLSPGRLDPRCLSELTTIGSSRPLLDSTVC